MSHASSTCRNCGHRIASWDHYCSHCGQETKNHPPAFWEFVHEWVQHYLALEGKLWRSLWNLMARPGRLTQEYLAGRKQHYVLPLRLVLTLGICFFLALKLAPPGDGFVQLGDEAKAARIAQASAEERKQAFANELPRATPDWLRERLWQMNENWLADPQRENKRLGQAVLRLLPYAVLFSIPFYAGLLQLVHGSGRRSYGPYGAHFVFALHLHAAWYGCCLLLLVPLGWLGTAAFIWANAYPVLALKRVYAASWWLTLLRAGLLALLHLLLIALGLLIVLVLGAIGD